MKIASAAVAVVTWLVLTDASSAGCIVSPYRFDPYISDNVSVHAVTDNGTCGHLYRPGDMTMFSTSSILKPPHNGTLTKTRAFEYHYAAKTGFKGEDSYTTKVCGSQRGQSGCSTISYLLTVK